jgi:hypothetical protein
VGEREGVASVGEATGYITAMCHMFGITLTLIHMQHTGHGISEGKCGYLHAVCLELP